jgi:hypothetical protein
MNNRIDQLAELALTSLDEDVERIITRIDGLCPQFIHQFAKLVVKDCINVIYDNKCPDGYFGSHDAGFALGCVESVKNIKQHFDLI